MTLPRPVKGVLAPATDAAVIRTWARLQRTRRLGSSRPVAWVLATAALALVGVSATLLVRAAHHPLPQAVAAPMLGPTDARPTPTIARGRLGSSARSASPLLHVSPPAVTPAPADPVATLLQTAAEAVRNKKFSRAADLLREVAEHHTADPRAALAMYALGRLQLDNLRQPIEARESFSRALQLQPPEELRAPIQRALTDASSAPGDDEG